MKNSEMPQLFDILFSVFLGCVEGEQWSPVSEMSHKTMACCYPGDAKSQKARGELKDGSTICHAPQSSMGLGEVPSLCVGHYFGGAGRQSSCLKKTTVFKDCSHDTARDHSYTPRTNMAMAAAAASGKGR